MILMYFQPSFSASKITEQIWIFMPPYSIKHPLFHDQLGAEDIVTEALKFEIKSVWTLICVSLIWFSIGL